MSGAVNGHPSLRAVLEEACSAGFTLKELTVLSVPIDPYRLDTPTGHAEGAWLAEQMERLLGPWRRIHLRGLHYALVAAGELVKPNGERYLNADPDWLWLQQSAAKSARWLGYVPFDRITDERNAAPVIRTAQAMSPQVYVSTELEVTVPDVGDLRPHVSLWDFEARQAVNLVISGEKTSLDPVLAPIGNAYKASLYLPSGEISDTLLYQMARTGAEDGRPMVVFVLADFDPAGNQMAVSIGRKLQALRDLHFPALDFEVRAIALTEDQVRELDLPSTPLKVTEKRADRWREAHGGLEQTEIDALATLRPDVLREIVEDALDPFFDHELGERVEDAEREWKEDAQQALDDQLDGDLLARIKAEAEEKLAAVREEIEKLNEKLRPATPDLGIDLPLLEIPEADRPGGEGKPLLSSAWSWTEQTRALIARKQYEDAP